MLLPQKLEKRILILTSNFTLVMGLFCTGPSTLFNLPNSDIILLAGLGVTGFSGGVSKTLAQVESVTGGVEVFPLKSASISLSISKYMAAQLGVTYLITPPLSILLYKLIGFNKTLDLFGCLYAVYFIALLIGTINGLRKEAGSFKEEKDYLLRVEQAKRQ